MDTITDAAGRTIAVAPNPDGSVSCTIAGITVTADSTDAALASLSGMLPPPAPDAPPPPSLVSPLDFMARFTSAEQVAVAGAGQSNPLIMLFLLKLSAAPRINVLDRTVHAGLSLLAQQGLLTADRMAVIADLSHPSP